MTLEEQAAYGELAWSFVQRLEEELRTAKHELANQRVDLTYIRQRLAELEYRVSLQNRELLRLSKKDN